MLKFETHTALRMWLQKRVADLAAALAGRPLPYNVFEQTSPHYARFPDPPKNERGTVKANYLGQRYYNGMYPRWIMWNYKEPETLYINVDFLIATYKQHVYDSVDKVAFDAIITLAKEYAARLVIHDRCAQDPDPGAIKLYWRTNNNSNLPVSFESWVTPEILKKFEDS
jgi:hypothetical protein